MRKVKKIRKFPDSCLRIKCIPVDVINGDYLSTIENLQETQIFYKALGISANQIGSYKKICIALNTILINPEIINGYGSIISKEGCLSIPRNIEIEIERYETVEVSYYDENGKRCIEKFEGLKAKVIQHEVDHLNGILIIDC